jgi:hypothetical protein
VVYGIINLWRKDRRFYYAIHTMADIIVFARVYHMFDWMAYGELEIFAYNRVEVHYIHRLESLAFPRITVLEYGLDTALVQCPGNTGDSDTLRGGIVFLVSIYQHRQIHIPTEL